jgi:hypothetical protein
LLLDGFYGSFSTTGGQVRWQLAEAWNTLTLTINIETE